MARNRSTSAKQTHQNSGTEAQHNGEGHGHHGNASGPAPDWLSGSLAVAKKTLDSLLETQCQCLKSASLGSDTLAQDLKELQQAKDPVEFLSAQFALVNRRLETFTRELATVMQNIYDAPLMWLGQWDEKAETSPQVATIGQPAQDTFGALGRARDAWLKTTQSWIDGVSAASHPGHAG